MGPDIEVGGQGFREFNASGRAGSVGGKMESGNRSTSNHVVRKKKVWSGL